ncbi:MAG: hypothetical protein O3A53_19270, partial [Acidobacteria bacterium]|nr:hypothetical protein [Acidobacteriota bacterium]
TAFIGIDLSIPLTVQMDKPRIGPKSQGPAAQPQKLKGLVGKWQAWADRVGGQPWPLKRLAN